MTEKELSTAAETIADLIFESVIDQLTSDFSEDNWIGRHVIELIRKAGDKDIYGLRKDLVDAIKEGLIYENAEKPLSSITDNVIDDCFGDFYDEYYCRFSESIAESIHAIHRRF